MARDISEFLPDVALIELREGERERVALARQLRAEASTYALPIIFLYQRDERAQRNAALNIGVDDYFALSTQPSEMQARLDALFWRTHAGRRAAPVVGEQHAEIDNFLLLLDAVRAEMEKGSDGAVALIEAAAREGEVQSRPERERVLAEAHGFLKLNLRRMDNIAFYGPMTLLVYLPNLEAAADFMFGR